MVIKPNKFKLSVVQETPIAHEETLKGGNVCIKIWYKDMLNPKIDKGNA